MLMKPPPILDDLISQDSENYTARSKDRSSKTKQGKKENTLRFGSNPPPPADKPKDYDSESVHSTGSRKSKDKRAKETTLSRPKVMGEGSQHREDDAHSVHSNGSRHSHKSTKKENTIMSRPKMETAMPRNREERPTEIEPKFRSFKDAIAEPEESIIRVLEPSVDSPRPINYREDRFAGKPNKV